MVGKWGVEYTSVGYGIAKTFAGDIDRAGTVYVFHGDARPERGEVVGPLRRRVRQRARERLALRVVEVAVLLEQELGERDLLVRRHLAARPRDPPLHRRRIATG